MRRVVPVPRRSFPFGFLADVKVQLRTTHWRMLEIARAVGHRTKASLYRAFYQILGITPEQYRTRWQLVRANNRVAELLNLNRHCQI